MEKGGHEARDTLKELEEELKVKQHLGLRPLPKDRSRAGRKLRYRGSPAVEGRLRHAELYSISGEQRYSSHLTT